jgi:cAMP phosphodiesterase
MLFDEGSHFLQEIQPSAFCSLSCEPLVQSPFRISWSDFGEPEQSLLFFRTNYEVTYRVMQNVTGGEAVETHRM